MMKLRRNWRIFIGCGMLMLVTAGCFQDVNDAESQNVVSQLNTSTPTDTPPPTEPPLPSETPTEIPTETPTPTQLDSLVSDTGIGGGTAIAQELGTPFDDTWALTATQIVAEITQTSDASFTQTAQFLLGSFTQTPTPSPTIQLAPGITPSATLIAAPPGTVCIHEVKAGENLFRLSMTYGVSVQQLASASGVVNINQIWVGDRINIPGCGTTGVFPPPTTVPTPLPQTTTGGTLVQPGVDASAQTVPPVAGGTTHVVQQYETLFQISMTYGVPVASIANANGITDINNILMGTQLIIPSQ